MIVFFLLPKLEFKQNNDQTCAHACDLSDEESPSKRGVSFVTPALGTLWAHCVNNRIVMEYYGTQRRITIAKSPVSPVISFTYRITGRGVELVREADIVPNPENYWEMKIIARTHEVAPGISVQSQHQLKPMETFQYPTASKPPQFPMVNFDDLE